VSVLLGNGNGTFSTQGGTSQTGSWPQRGRVAAKDINGDGKPDILVAKQETMPRSACSSANGGRRLPAQGRLPNERLGVVDRRVADVNNDGTVDILTGGGSSAVAVLLGRGGRDVSRPRSTMPPVSNRLWVVASGSRLADRKPDSRGLQHDVEHAERCSMNEGGGAFHARVELSNRDASGRSVAGRRPSTADGKLDLVVAKRGPTAGQPTQ